MAEHNIIRLIKASGHLPQIPNDIVEILKMLQDPNEYDVDKCVQHFSRSPQLGDALLQALKYRVKFKHSISTVKEALNYLGARNAKTIAISYITRLLLPDSKGRAKLFDNSKYWNHCIGTAAAAYMIAEKSGLSDRDKLFTYGLIHDIGVTVLDICLPDFLDKIHVMHQKGVHQIVAEKIVLNGITHADIGMWICEEWGLPDEIAAIVGFHHTPLLSKKHVDAVRIMYLADSISTNYYEKLLGNNTTFIYVDKLMEALKVDKEFIENIIVKLSSEIDIFNQMITL